MSFKPSSAVALAAVFAVGCATRPDNLPPPAPPAPVQSTLPAPSSAPPVTVAEDAQTSALLYRQSISLKPAPEVVRERNRLTPAASTPAAQLRLALLLAQPRTGDLAKAMLLVESLLKSTEPAATALHPLAALLAEQLAERLRLEANGERLAGQLKENQRRVGELQEKLERLTNIERSLPGRPLPHGRTP